MYYNSDSLKILSGLIDNQIEEKKSTKIGAYKEKEGANLWARASECRNPFQVAGTGDRLILIFSPYYILEFLPLSSQI